MSIKLTIVAVAALTACLFATLGSAHHSAAGYDRTKEVVLSGTVREFQWTNPHVWIQLDVPDGTGKVVVWSIEDTNPLALARQGWKRTSFKPGDKVVITVNPTKDGRSVAHFVRATLADGSTLGAPAPAPAPARP